MTQTFESIKKAAQVLLLGQPLTLVWLIKNAGEYFCYIIATTQKY